MEERILRRVQWKETLVQAQTPRVSPLRAFNYVKDSCHGTQSCEMTASNSNFGDTCLGTYKYLNVTYECVPDWPIVLSKDGTVGVINGVGEVHVSASEMKVYGNMNVSEGDINIGGYGLSRFNSRIEDIENATETLLQLQTQLENNIKRPPYCMSPSADGLQHDGTDWICACRDGLVRDVVRIRGSRCSL